MNEGEDTQSPEESGEDAQSPEETSAVNDESGGQILDESGGPLPG